MTAAQTESRWRAPLRPPRDVQGSRSDQALRVMGAASGTKIVWRTQMHDPVPHLATRRRSQEVTFDTYVVNRRSLRAESGEIPIVSCTRCLAPPSTVRGDDENMSELAPRLRRGKDAKWRRESVLADSPEARIRTNDINRDMGLLGSQQGPRRRRESIDNPRNSPRLVEGRDLKRVRGGGDSS